LHQFRGIALYRLGQYQAAINAFHQAATPSGTADIVEGLFLAMSQWQLGNKKEAMDWYAKAINRLGANQLDRTSVYDIFAAPKVEFLAEAKEVLRIDEAKTAKHK
jgi:tetratricopeptide (TPR) repeat protein